MTFRMGVDTHLRNIPVIALMTYIRSNTLHGDASITAANRDYTGIVPWPGHSAQDLRGQPHHLRSGNSYFEQEKSRVK